MTIRAWYNRRDFFGGIEWDQEAAREFSTVAEGEKLVARCLSSLALGGVNACGAFRLERADGLLLVVHPAGPGAYRLTRARNGSGDAGTLYGARELKKVLRCSMVDELQEVC